MYEQLMEEQGKQTWEQSPLNWAHSLQKVIISLADILRLLHGFCYYIKLTRPVDMYYRRLGARDKQLDIEKEGQNTSHW